MFEGVASCYSYKLNNQKSIGAPIYSKKREIVEISNELQNETNISLPIGFKFVKYGSFEFRKGFYIPNRRKDNLFLF